MAEKIDNSDKNSLKEREKKGWKKLNRALVMSETISSNLIYT